MASGLAWSRLVFMLSMTCAVLACSDERVGERPSGANKEAAMGQQLQGREPVAQRLPHAQQQPRGEGDPQTTGLLQLAQSHRQAFARRLAMQGVVGRAEPFQHQPHGAIKPAQGGHFSDGEGARVCVRQPAFYPGQTTKGQ